MPDDTLGLSFSFGAAAGPSRQDFARCLDQFEEPLREAADWIADGADKNLSGFGWYALPDRDIADVLETAKWLSGYEAIVHAGIGGSSLGNLMLHQALLPFYGNEKQGGPRFYLADNPDPDKALAIWERVAGSRVALIGVSKSGATAETMSQFLWFRSKMEAAAGRPVDDDILVITDPEGGVFRSYARATGCRSLEIPPSVGGRFSVLSPCGLVTAAALGADASALMQGAREMRDCLAARKSADENPAFYLAALSRYHEKNGRNMTVLMPYANRLETFAEWFAQLWGESLGKDGMGSTPVRALGAIDQHSQVQLYTAGPDDKLYTLIDVKRRAEDITLPQVDDDSLASLSYLSRRGMAEMLEYEAMSTTAALIKKDRPVVWIELEKLDARTLGALVFFYEYTTALTGRLMNVDPFDQPGVEQGKRYTYGWMGRKSYEPDAKEAEELFGRVRETVVRT